MVAFIEAHILYHSVISRITGAERLIVDAATALAERGHKVDVFTAHHDKTRSFEETNSGLFNVSVYGDWFPRHIGGKGHALCAYVRCTIIALIVTLLCLIKRKRRYDLVIVDQVSIIVPVVRLLAARKTLFYCHFPDLLLAQRASVLRRVYRAPIDYVEELTTGAADCLLVNSRYTKEVFKKTFTRLKNIKEPEILYPAVHIPSQEELNDALDSWSTRLPEHIVSFIKQSPTFLSINRFERKKGIDLAIEALSLLPVETLCHLIIAGGFDHRVLENVEHLQELKDMVERLGLRTRVLFMPSFSDTEKKYLLAACTGVLYTPQNEHFGIVPLEAGAAGRAVIACNSGGPLESIVHCKTGLLLKPDAALWGTGLSTLLRDEQAAMFGRAARKHVQSKFSRTAFGEKLEATCMSLVLG